MMFAWSKGGLDGVFTLKGLNYHEHESEILFTPTLNQTRNSQLWLPDKVLTILMYKIIESGGKDQRKICKSEI